MFLEGPLSCPNIGISPDVVGVRNGSPVLVHGQTGTSHCSNSQLLSFPSRVWWGWGLGHVGPLEHIDIFQGPETWGKHKFISADSCWKGLLQVGVLHLFSKGRTPCCGPNGVVNFRLESPRSLAADDAGKLTDVYDYVKKRLGCFRIHISNKHSYQLNLTTGKVTQPSPYISYIYPTACPL